MEREYCLESGTEVGLDTTGEGADEDSLTLALYCLGTKALGPLLRACVSPSVLGIWAPSLHSQTGPKSEVALTNPEGASLPLSLCLSGQLERSVKGNMVNCSLLGFNGSRPLTYLPRKGFCQRMILFPIWENPTSTSLVVPGQ